MKSNTDQTTKINTALNTNQREGVKKILDTILADEYLLMTKTKAFHWNITGMQFVPLHAFFEEQYQKLSEFVDETAERIRALDFPAPANLAEFLASASLPEAKRELVDGQIALAALLEDHEKLVRDLRHSAEKCQDEHGDSGNNDFLIGLMKEHEKLAWMLRAHLVK